MLTCFKVLGLLSLLTTASDAAIMAELHSKESEDKITANSIVSGNFTESPSKSALFRDITAEREFFNRFNFAENGHDTICGINRKIQNGRDTLGLLLLEPSGVLKTLVIDRGTLAIIHRNISLPRKELREEFRLHGIPVSNAKLIARQATKEQAVTQ